MKINWFSPLPPARTGVAAYALHVLERLSAEHEVTLWTDQREVARGVSRFGEVRKLRLSAVPWERINRADFSIYHMGNHADFHGAILEVSSQCPGVVVLHDMRLHDLIYMLYFHARRDRDGYLDMLHRWYGAEGRRAGEAFCAGGLSSEHMIERFPLTRAALEGALGVVVHSDALGSTGEMPECPVRMAPHPYAPMEEREYAAIAEARRGRVRPPYRLLLFGYLGRNRRIESVLRGLAECGRKEDFRLEICGALWDEARVRGLIAELGLSGVVSLRGYLSDGELAQALKGADLAFNLRYPSMGEASGSQCRLWDYGVPSLVTRTQWYASLPEDTVGFVRVEEEIEDIAGHLGAFAEDPGAYYARGENGRRLLARFDPGLYARGLVEFAGEARGYAPRLAALRLAERVGDDAGRWLAPYAADGLFERVERELGLVGKGGGD